MKIFAQKDLEANHCTTTDLGPVGVDSSPNVEAKASNLSAKICNKCVGVYKKNGQKSQKSLPRIAHPCSI